jgi:hypothetical protein
MMGRQDAPEKLFYQFRLEDHVPSDHPLRQLDAVLRFDRARTVLASHYSRKGRPSIDPELMLGGGAFGNVGDRLWAGRNRSQKDHSTGGYKRIAKGDCSAKHERVTSVREAAGHTREWCPVNISRYGAAFRHARLR